MRSVKDRLERIRIALLKPINTSGIGILGTFTLIWGVWLALPGWSVFAGNHDYVVMQQMMPEWGWGIAGIVVGLVMIYGTVKNSYKALSIGAMTSYYFWFLITLLHLLSNWRSESWIFTLMTALYALFVALNLRVNRKIIEFKPESGKSLH